MFVPEFRFGNMIPQQGLLDDNFIDGYINIDKSNIDLKRDLLLAHKCLCALERYISNIKVPIYLLYYTMFFRHVYDAYHHKNYNPIFDLKTYEKYFPNNTLEIQYTQPLADYYCLINDPSLHESNLGFLALYNILHWQDGKTKDFDVAMKAAREYQNKILAGCLGQLKENTLICGDSICLRDLSEQLDDEMLENLWKKNVHIIYAPPRYTDVRDTEVEVSNIVGFIIRHQIEHVLYFSKYVKKV